jgi:hypothetical protein
MDALIDDEDPIEFSMDYSNDDPRDIGDFLWFLYGDDYEVRRDRNDRPDHRSNMMGDFLESGGKINDALALIYCSPTFGLFQDTYLKKALVNYQTGTPPTQPAALVVKTYGALDAANIPAAQQAVETWLSYAAAHGLPTEQGLLDAYVDLGPDHAATKILGYIKDNFGDDGSLPSDLMEVYRKLNEAGHFGNNPPTSTSPPAGYPSLQARFDFEQHPVSGWSYLALTSLMRQQTTKGQVDATMLANLDKEDAWAGAYFRWQALQDQLDAGQPLNPDYLTSLAGKRPLAATDLCKQVLNAQITKHENLDTNLLEIVFANDRAAGIDICNRSFDDAFQPTNRLAPESATGVDPTYSLTNQTQPVIRVSLSSMGAALPSVGDVIELHDETGTVIGQATVTLTQTVSGYADIRVGQGLSNLNFYLSDGPHSITSRFSPSGSLVPSDLSVPLPVQVMTRAPQMSGVSSDGSHIVYEFSMPAPPDSPADYFVGPKPLREDFVATRLDRTTPVVVVDVTLDAVAGRLQVTCEGSGDVLLEYRPQQTPLRDVAGNAVVIPYMYIPKGSSVPPVIERGHSSDYKPLPPARILDMGTWNLLNRYDPVNAQQTYGRFKVAGLLYNSFPDFSNLSIEEAVQAVSLGRSENIEQTLRIQVTGLSAKNSEMRRDNTVLGDLGNMSPQVPSSTTSDKTVASVLKDKFQPLVDQINKDLKAAGLTNLFPTPGGMLDGSVTVGQLQGAIDKLKEVVDNLSTESNSDMLGLQSSTTKRNEAIQFVSDLLAKLAALISGMIQNIKD